ncbi:MAG TPA: protein kinase [Pyrinomonadaceae bacterium]|nr:protein kinase [Pyrinomonadaceae bacterium]
MASQNENDSNIHASAGTRGKPRLGKIFISYRRVDSAGYAGHIHEKLASHFGPDSVFMDIDNLAPGMRFDQHIQEVLGSCSVLLAVIGRYWFSDDRNQSINAPQGWMRTELGTALRLGVPIIPVLVHGAIMPTPDQLPEDLTTLAYWQAVEIRDKNFQYDVEQLIKSITEIISSTRLDRYKLGARLGGGRSGEVFLAEDTLSLGRTVVVKKLHAHITQNERLLREFESCARAICGLDNPNILHTYDIGRAGSCHFIVTEFFDGQTLRNRMASGPIRLLDSIRITKRIAEALATAHSVGVIHGDLRPENVLVNSDHRVKVFDFGLTGLLDQIQPEELPPEATPDAIVRIMYRSPEQLSGEQIDVRTDVWNVGLIIYELVMERPPFERSSVEEVREAIFKKPRESPSFNTGETDIDTSLSRIVGKALCAGRDERYKSAKELIAELDDLETLARIHLSRLGTSSEPERRVGEREVTDNSGKRLKLHFRRRRYLLAIIAVVVAVLTIVAGAAIYFSPTPVDSVAIMPATVEGSDDPMSKAIALDITRNIQSNLLGLHSLTVKDASSNAEKQFACRIALNKGELKVYAELREVRTGKIIAGWHSYTAHVADWKVLTQQLAADIVNQMHVPLTPEEAKHLKQRASFNQDAAELYLAGRWSWQKRTKEDFKVAITKYEQTIRMDPEFALAYVGIADSYHLLPFYDSSVSSDTALTNAEAAINKALALNSDLLEAYISRAMIRYQYKRDFAGAAEDFDRLQTNAYHYATGWQWYSEFLLVMGKYEDANEKAGIALEYDHHSPIVRANLSYVAYYSRDFKRAVDDAYDAINSFPYFRRTYTYLGNALEQQEKYDEAIDNFAEGGDRVAASYRSGPRGKWEEYLKAREKNQRETSGDAKVQYYELAETCARLGKQDEALSYLRQAIDQKSNRVVFIGANPRFAKLCSPRFNELVRQVGVPAKICGE